MTGVEDLVRATLTDPRRRLDPPAGHHDRIAERIRRARRRRTARSLGALAGAAVLVAAGGLAAGHQTGTAGHRAAAPPVPSTRPGALSRQYLVGDGTPVAVTACGGGFCLVESDPDVLLRLDAASLSVIASAPVPGVPLGVAVAASGTIWVWYTTKDGGVAARAYDPARNLAGGREVPVDATQVSAGAVIPDGGLVLATDNGLYRTTTEDATATRESGIAADVSAVAVDMTRDRILFDETAADGVRPGMVYLHGGRGPSGGVIRLGKEEIAVVGGEVWIGGYNDAGDRDATRLVHLEPDTLRPAGGSPVEPQVGPGAIIWPGSSVLWVRDGGDEALSCLDPVSGAILAQWRSVQGPVASVPGSAVAIDGPFLVKPVLTGACRG